MEGFSDAIVVVDSNLKENEEFFERFYCLDKSWKQFGGATL